MGTEPIKKYTLREAQALLEVNNKTLSDMSGVSRTAIQRIHSGRKNPHQTNVRVAELLAEALGMSVNEIDWPNGLSDLGRPPLTGTPITVINVTVVTVNCCDNCFIQLPLAGGPCPFCTDK